MQCLLPILSRNLHFPHSVPSIDIQKKSPISYFFHHAVTRRGKLQGERRWQRYSQAMMGQLQTMASKFMLFRLFEMNICEFYTS